jgi:eukaryotic-like serine/threonine-protein kinase
VSAGVDPHVEQARTRIGESLRGKWTLERLIGVGGMAAVYAATHRNGLRGAVKMLHPELNAMRAITERFLREGYAANRVDHPGVVRVLDDDVTQDGTVFLVMELLEGQTVDALAAARPGGRLSLGEVLAVADMVLDVLDVAHDKGVVHRDLKPENLFLTTKGKLRVLDFGIARVRELQGSGAATQIGAAMGTPAFMPPEQASGQWSLVDARTDLWAVGATMFQLLTGRHVHEAPTLQLLMAAAMTRPAPPVASVEPCVTPAVAAIVDRALAFDRDDRWPHARAMQGAVRAARAGSPFSSLPARGDDTAQSGALWVAPAASAPAASAPERVEATLLAANPTTSPVSSGPSAPQRARSAGKALAVAGFGAAALAVAASAWLASHRFARAAAASSATALPAAPSDEPAVGRDPAAGASASSAPSVLPAPSSAATDEASSASPVTARPRPSPPSPPSARPRAPGAPKHPGMY